MRWSNPRITSYNVCYTKLLREEPTKNLALDLVRVTEAAALASSRWLGRGDKESGDKAAA